MTDAERQEVCEWARETRRRIRRPTHRQLDWSPPTSIPVSREFYYKLQDFLAEQSDNLGMDIARLDSQMIFCRIPVVIEEPMNPAHPPFLRAIIAAPADDLPRLIYADWLDETAGKSLCRACKGTGGTWEPQCCIPCHGTGFVSNGHAERAEFIRVQCRLDAVYDDRERDGKGKWRLDDGASLDEYRAIRRREREIGEKHGQRWVAELLGASKMSEAG